MLDKILLEIGLFLSGARLGAPAASHAPQEPATSDTLELEPFEFSEPVLLLDCFAQPDMCLIQGTAFDD